MNTPAVPILAAFGLAGFTAFAQDWVTIGDPVRDNVYDDFLIPGIPIMPEQAGMGDVNIEVLWATMGTSDPFPDTSPYGEPSAGIDIPYLLSNGWNLAQNYNSGFGSATLGTVETTTGGTTGDQKAGFIVAYNSGEPFEISPTSIYGGSDSGDDIELIYIGFNGSASSYYTATAVGISGMMVDPVGSSAGDPNSDYLQDADNPALTPFGVGGVPEPTTLALAGLGGLSMLFLRRRKA
jgi:PEP-CTERM motif